jgi:hypothetical protein
MTRKKYPKKSNQALPPDPGREMDDDRELDLPRPKPRPPPIPKPGILEPPKVRPPMLGPPEPSKPLLPNALPCLGAAFPTSLRCAAAAAAAPGLIISSTRCPCGGSTSFALPLSGRGVELLDSGEGATSFPLPLSTRGAELFAVGVEARDPSFDLGASAFASIQ